MAVPEGLKTSLNKLREVSSDIFHQYVPIITDTTNIGEFASPILENPNVMNEFCENLLQRLVYTSFEIKYFRNPLQVLEGDRIPLGYSGQEIYTNPAKGRKFNTDDFAGLLYKYESDTKVQYMVVNSDLQYPVTVSRHKLKQAFVSWEALDTYIDELSNSLYNGAYIDQYRFTKELVSSAYKSNSVQVEQISAPSTEALAKDFITKVRADFLNFQVPSTEYNGWAKVGGYGRPITTWTNPEDVVFLVRNDIRAFIDVNVLASAFNMDKADLVGRILTVDNFDVYDDDGTKIFDGSAIVGMIADASWFRIKEQDMYFDEFYNANNRTWQYYLNVTRMYQYSLFANAKVYATALPSVTISELAFPESSITVDGAGDEVDVYINVTPFQSTTPTIVYTSSDTNETYFEVDTDSDNNRHIKITGVSAGSGTVTATAGNVTATLSVTVSA